MRHSQEQSFQWQEEKKESNSPCTVTFILSSGICSISLCPPNAFPLALTVLALTFCSWNSSDRTKQKNRSQPEQGATQPWPWTRGKCYNYQGSYKPHRTHGAAAFLPFQWDIKIIQSRGEQSHCLQNSSHPLAWGVTSASTPSSPAAGDIHPQTLLWGALIKSQYLLRALHNHLIPRSIGIQSWQTVDLYYLTISKPVSLYEKQIWAPPWKMSISDKLATGAPPWKMNISDKLVTGGKQKQHFKLER